MKNLFIVQKSDPEVFTVTGKDIYDLATNLDEKKLTFEDSATLNVLIKVNAKEEETLVSASICEHTGDFDYSTLNINGDSLYKVVHYILPTLEYVLGHPLEYYPATLYVYHNGNIYKPTSKDWLKVDIEELVLVNDEAIYGGTAKEMFTFTMQNLRDCYVSIAEKLLCDLCDSDKCLQNSNNLFILDRDLVWMAINCILYALDDGNFLEAQRILERILTCSGPCAKTAKGKGCGCGQKPSNKGGCGCGKY